MSGCSARNSSRRGTSQRAAKEVQLLIINARCCSSAAKASTDSDKRSKPSVTPANSRRPFFRQGNRAVAPFEQRLIEITFQRLDLVADRGRGYVQFGRGIGQAFQATCGFERA